MNPYLKFVQDIESGIADAKKIAVAGEPKEVVKAASKALLFSPHPDDECITGLLPLRLMAEQGKQIINIPVTYGSDVGRQAGRSKELADACGYLGWAVSRPKDDFTSLDVYDVVRVLTELDPDVVFMPHSEDWNVRHIATHHLVADALKKMPAAFSCTVVETEFWGAMDDPNLMVEGDAELVSELMTATAFHTEEVARNPYHLLLPAWMQDNVRRGGELVGGQGGAVPDFSFATLYRIRKWENGEFVQCLEKGTAVPVGAENLKEIF